MIFVPYLLAVAALGASDAAAAPIRRAATQLTDDATAAWVSRCEQSGGGQYCVELGVDGQLALQSSADVCAQLNVTEQMVDLAKTLNGDTEMVRLTQLFAQQPRDSADGLSVLYCQTAPKHTELTGLYPCQYDSNNLSSFTNRAAAGAQGTRPFGTITVNPAGSCPAHTSGPIPSGKLLGSLVSDPGVKNVRVNSGVAGAAAKAKSGKAAVNTNSYNSYPNYNSYNNYRNNYYAGYGSYGANTNKIANTNYNSGGSRKSKAVVSSSYQQPTRYGSHYPWKFSLVARDDDDDEDAAAQPPPPPPAADNSAQTSTTSSAPASTPATTTPDLNAQQGVTDPNAAAVQQPPNGSMNPNLMFGMNGPQGMTNPMMGNQMYPGMNPMMNPYTGMPQMQPGMNSLASMQQPGNNPLTGMPQSNPFASMQQSQMTGMQQPGVNPMQDPTMQMMAMQQQGTTPPGTTPPGMAPPQMQATTQPPLSLSSIISSIGTALSGATTALSSAATAFTQVAWGVGNLTMTLSPPTTSPPMTPPPNTPPHCIQHYISVQGDTCDTLAMKFGLSASDVYNANTFLNCQNIWVGTPICVPPPSTPQQQQQQMAQQPPLSGMQQGPQPGMQGPQPGQQFPDPSQMAQQQPPQGAQQPGFPQTQSQAFQMPPGQVDPSQLAAQGQQQQPPFGQQQPSSFGQQGPQPGSPQMMDPSMQQFGGQQQQPGVQSQQLPPQTQAFAVPPTQQQQQGTTQSFGSQQPGSQQPSPFSGHFSAHQKSNKMANTRPTANYMTGQPQRKSVTYSSGSWQGQSSEAAQAAYDRIQQAQQQQQQAYDDLARLQSGATQTYSNAETRNAAAFSKAKVQHKSAMGGSNEVAMGGSNLVSTAGNLDAYTRMLAAQMQMQQAQNDLNNLYSSATTGYATTGSQRVASSKAFSGYNGFAFNGYNNNAASRKSAVPAQSATMSTGGQFQPYSRVNHMYGTPQYGSGSTYVNPLSSTGFGTQHKAMKHSAMMKDMSDPNDPNANGGQCNHGDQQCMNGGFAQCVWGTWQVSPCGEGTQCFALPNGDGSNAFVCDTPEDAAMRMGGGSPPPQDPNAGQQDPNAGQQDPSQADPNAGQDQSQQQQEQPQPDPSQQQPPAEGGGDDGW